METLGRDGSMVWLFVERWKLWLACGLIICWEMDTSKQHYGKKISELRSRMVSCSEKKTNTGNFSPLYIMLHFLKQCFSFCDTLAQKLPRSWSDHENFFHQLVKMFISIPQDTINFSSLWLTSDFSGLIPGRGRRSGSVVSKSFWRLHLLAPPEFPHVPVHKIAPSPSGLPLGRLPGISMSITCLRLFSCSLRCTCPNHLSLLSLALLFILPTPSSFLISSFFILSFTVTPLFPLSILISVFSRIFSSFTPVVQHSAPYKITGLTTVVYSLVFNFAGIFLSAITGPNSLHFCHPAFTLALTAVSDPPSLLKVTPSYLNWSTWFSSLLSLSLMFTLVPFLPLTITSVFPVFTFSPLLSIPIRHFSDLLWRSSSESAMIARSSAKSSSHGSPFLHSSLIVPSTMVKRKGLRPDPWWSPTSISNWPVLPWAVRTSVDAFL